MSNCTEPDYSCICCLVGAGLAKLYRVEYSSAVLYIACIVLAGRNLVNICRGSYTPKEPGSPK